MHQEDLFVKYLTWIKIKNKYMINFLLKNIE